MKPPGEWVHIVLCSGTLGLPTPNVPFPIVGSFLITELTLRGLVQHSTRPTSLAPSLLPARPTCGTHVRPRLEAIHKCAAFVAAIGV
jgi:hypothetical protein